jgi:hypothetical protein
MERNGRSTSATDALEAKRNPKPSYALIDSQSVKIASTSDVRGFDGGKNQRP